ncbi:MAG: preprotein translocase subunit SecG [Ferrovibrio sp.]
MQNVILVIHILACLAMIGLVLVQKSEGGGLGIGGGSGNSLMSGRGAAGALVRTTMIFGGIFFITSLALTSIANRSADTRSGIERALEQTGPENTLNEPIDLFDPTAPLLNEAPIQPLPQTLPEEAPASPEALEPAPEEQIDTPVDPQ